MELAKSIIEALMLGLSLSADCFAVSLCSSVGMSTPEKRKTAGLALVFAVIQTSLLLAGWLLGHLFSSFLETRLAHFEIISSVTAFILLMFVAIEMFISALRGKTEKINLSGVRNILIGAVATSIDALTVGISMALADGAEVAESATAAAGVAEGATGIAEGAATAAAGVADVAATGAQTAGILLAAAAVFVTTALAVVVGILSGAKLGRNFGRAAVFAGSAILAAIAVTVLL